MGYGAGDDALPMASLTTVLDELKSLGASVIVLNQTRAKKAASNCLGSASDFEWVGAFPDRLGEILDAAAARGMQVWVGTTMSTTACPQPWLPPNNDLVRSDVATAMAQLYADWGSHPAFAGWYLPDEPGHLPSWLHGYYYNLRWELKQLSPEKPVMVSPYLAGSPPAPDEIAAAAVSFRDATGIEVQAWQDSVGATSTKLPSWSRSGHSVQEYFVSLRAAIGSQLWADVELFNYGKPLFNPSGVTGGYRSAAAARIAEQLDATSLAEHVVSWLPQYHASSLGTAAGYGEGPRLLDALRAMASSQRVPICKYSWASTPDSQYPDTGIELFDGKTADPTTASDGGWTGTLGEAIAVIDLGGARAVRRIAAHVLTMPAWGIRAPSGMVLECSQDGISFQGLAAVTSPIVAGDYSSVEQEEYVIDSGAPVSATCSHLRVTLQNEPGTWTFVSEVEVL